ncbi:relA-associated inhibitor isoform X2 [Pleuronectes platessa]|nr:relA-associated inhibitor isoform X2 [Pleuronectes platessa]
MSSQAGFGSSMLFQTINDDLNASLATADELSQEFSSLMRQASTSNNNTNSGPQVSITVTRDRPESNSSTGSSNGSSSDYVFSSNTNKNTTSPPVFSHNPLSSHMESSSSVSRSGTDSYSYRPASRSPSPHSPRRESPVRYDRSPRGSVSYAEMSPPPSRAAAPVDQSSHHGSGRPSTKLLSPHSQSARLSPRRDRSPSPLAFRPTSSTLPRNFNYRQTEEGVQRQKSPGQWNETDLDMSYEKKPHHTYDKTEWLRPSVPNSGWRETNLDGPPPSPSPKKDPRSPSQHFPHNSLPRKTRVTVPPDVSSPVHSPYFPQPIASRISIPPTNTEKRQRRPIPLSVLMRLQNPHWGGLATCGGQEDMTPYQPAPAFPREVFRQPGPPPPPLLRQPAMYSDVLNPGDIDAELERLDYIHHLPAIQEKPIVPGVEQGEVRPPRPLSPTRLQPVVAPEAQSQVMHDPAAVLLLRAEIPRALKRRGSVDQSQPLQRASHYQPNQYKNLIDKLFRRREMRRKGEHASTDTSSSSEGEEAAQPPAPLPQTSTVIPTDFSSYRSILRRSNRERKKIGNRARLSPLVLLLDGALVGELETVQRAVQEMNDPSQPNDEGITALHNAICGGHYNVVDFLVRIGANVSAPDSHGWTPLHCAASCNDRPLCEFLVRNGAAVMAMTESDGAIASQKCDPYAVGFDECESFLKGVEEAMGTENSGVLYALWSYPAQAADELSFRDGDMVTILKKPEGPGWWWASLCGREGFVPYNYFGLFPKVRPKSLC